MKRKLTIPFGVNGVMTGKYRVRVEVLDALFCVHKSLAQETHEGPVYSSRIHWTLTHIPTRYSVANYFPSKESAIEAWKAIKNLIDWSFTNPDLGTLSRAEKRGVFNIVREYR